MNDSRPKLPALVFCQRPDGARSSVTFIHGLGGDLYRTWGSHPGTFIQRIARSFPESAVATYGYQTGFKRLFSPSRIPVEDLASVLGHQVRDGLLRKYDDVALVCHSLGGVLAMTALRRLLVTEPEWAERLRAGEKKLRLILMGTPQHGTSTWRLGWLSSELRVLSYNDRLVRENLAFWNSRIRPLNHKLGVGEIPMAMSAVISEADRWVPQISAGSSLPEKRILRVAMGHADLVKPPPEGEFAPFDFVCTQLRESRPATIELDETTPKPSPRQQHAPLGSADEKGLRIPLVRALRMASDRGWQIASYEDDPGDFAAALRQAGRDGVVPMWGSEAAVQSPDERIEHQLLEPIPAEHWRDYMFDDMTFMNNGEGFDSPLVVVTDNNSIQVVGACEISISTFRNIHVGSGEFSTWLDTETNNLDKRISKELCDLHNEGGHDSFGNRERDVNEQWTTKVREFLGVRFPSHLFEFEQAHSLTRNGINAKQERLWALERIITTIKLDETTPKPSPRQQEAPPANATKDEDVANQSVPKKGFWTAHRKSLLNWSFALIGLAISVLAWRIPVGTENPDEQPSIYSLRVQVLDPQNNPVAGSTVRASVVNEPHLLPDGWWELEIPRAKVPESGQITLYANHEAWRNGTETVTLGTDPNPQVIIRLEAPTSILSGMVTDGSQRAVVDARVWVIGAPAPAPEPVVTGVDGRFEITLPLPAKIRLRIHAEHPDFPLPVEPYCFTGAYNCSVILEGNRP